MPLPRLDVHQHLWPEPFVAALARRAEAPCLRREDGGWTLRLAGEPDAPLDLTASDPAVRRATFAEDGIDGALLCLSSPLGIETLPGDEARALIDAWHEGVFALGEPFGVWGALALDGATPSDVHALVDRGAAGLSLPAGVLGGPETLHLAGPLLEALAQRNRPLLVHPGPAPAGSERPAWWAAGVEYVAELHAAWHAWAGWGRRAHPGLRVLFVGLAGGAPLHLERLAARGGPAEAAFDPLTFYDTSCYGARAVEAVSGVVGLDQLVHGCRPARHGRAHGPAPRPRGSTRSPRSTRRGCSTAPPPTSPGCRRDPAAADRSRAPRRRRPGGTMHAYSPPLWRMGTYEVRPGGELARHPVSDAEELRPITA